MLRNYLILFVVIVLAACQTIKTTNSGAVGADRKQLMFSALSEKEVQAPTLTAYKQEIDKAQQQGALNTDKKQYARVKSIAARLIPHTAVDAGLELTKCAGLQVTRGSMLLSQDWRP